MRNKLIIIMIVGSLAVPAASARAATPLVDALSDRVNDSRRSINEIRKLQKEIDRLKEKSSNAERLADQADSELRKLRAEARLRDKLDDVRNEQGVKAIDTDLELQILRAQLRQSRLELKKAKEADKIRKELIKNENTVRKINGLPPL